MSESSVPVGDGDVSKECRGQNVDTAEQTTKQARKSKKHAKGEAEGKECARIKTKKHKKAHETAHALLNSDDPNSCLPAEGIAPPSDSNESVKKKRKHAKDGSKHKKTNQAGNLEVACTNLVERKHKQLLSDDPMDHVSDVRISAAKRSKVANLQQDTSRCDSQDDNMIPISPELTQQHSLPESPQPFRSPPPSSGSHYSSRGSRSPYSRSPSHRTSRTHQRHLVSQGSDRRGVVSRDRFPRRGKFDESRQINPRRTYVGYRRPSASRDTSPEEYFPDQFRSRRRRSHSRRSTEADRSSRTQGSRQTVGRQRILSPTQGSRQRRYHHHSRSRSPSEQLNRRHRDDIPYRRYHRSPKRYSTKDGGSDIHKKTSSHKAVPVERSRNDDGAPTIEARLESDVTRHESPGSLPRRSGRGEGASHPKRIRVSERSRSSSEQTEKRGHRKMRSSGSSDRSVRLSAPHSSEPSHEQASTSRSPKQDRARKSKLSSKVCSVLNLLGELGTDIVSDAELDSLLPLDILSGNDATDLNCGTLLTCPKMQLDQQQADELPPPPLESMADSAEKRLDDKNFRALSSLENISSQIRQKLCEPEQWDDSGELSPSSDHEADLDDESPTHQSLVTIATSRKSLPSRPQLITSMLMPWQELIESADSSCAPETAVVSSDLISPMVQPDDLLGSAACGARLLSMRNRACGAFILRHIGVSKRYMGADLLDCLNNELASVGDDTLTDTKASHAQLGQTEIAWMQRNPPMAESVSLSTTRPFVPHGGLLSSMSDALMRQQLLELVN
ncbi:hypothetical protein CRM22_000043 [Opisthorchis felineus]|uniref:Uncharacterized protein n=1 Tax=Opisthorchis felineus TaxID=147828 RepID=A0A4V3SHF3_OPIFE|nr:hypothetical protein CRM22_000043 [Opisthorchis felineus]